MLSVCVVLVAWSRVCDRKPVGEVLLCWCCMIPLFRCMLDLMYLLPLAVAGLWSLMYCNMICSKMIYVDSPQTTHKKGLNAFANCDAWSRKIVPTLAWPVTIAWSYCRVLMLPLSHVRDASTGIQFMYGMASWWISRLEILPDAWTHNASSFQKCYKDWWHFSDNLTFLTRLECEGLGRFTASYRGW